MAEVIGLGQLRSNMCGYLEQVLAGESIEVVRRGKLVARITTAANERIAPIALPDFAAVNGADGRVGLAALRTRAGRYFDRVEAGETIWVVWHDKLVARIVSATKDLEAPVDCAGATTATHRDSDDRVGLDELRRRAGRYFDRVAHGDTIEVVRGGKVVARIVSADNQHTSA